VRSPCMLQWYLREVAVLLLSEICGRGGIEGSFIIAPCFASWSASLFPATPEWRGIQRTSIGLLVKLRRDGVFLH
jgi:hypothetical protein